MRIIDIRDNHMETQRNRPKKKSTNLSVDSDLLRRAKQLKINLSRTLEQKLEEIIREAKTEHWLEENRSAIESYNRHVERKGAFSDKLRRF